MTHINAISKTLRPTRFPSVLQCALSRQYSTDSEQEIVIPKRIERGPTDVLRALSRTVNRDPTAPHYKYHDDPYLIPASNYSKRSFALAQESGRKAARWILEEHADLFQHKVADPFIEAFAPKQLITEESEVDIESLSKAICQLNVTDAITIFQVLQKKSVAVPKEDLQKLLELVCFYNAEDKSEEDWIEERWFKQGVRDRVRQRKTWKDGGVAETIFLGIDPPDAKSLSTLLVGMASYGQLDNAWKYYSEAKSKNIILHVNAYNALIKSSSFVKEQHEARWNLVKELLEEMNSNRVAPNVGTLNAVLEMLGAMPTHRNSKAYALSAIAEFRQLGILPSLASYYYLINLYCRDRTKTSAILIDIMNQLDGKKFIAQDPKDTFFFFTAMEISNMHLSDVNLANKINDLLLTGDNYNLIGDSYKESLYHRNYFMLKCEYDPIEDFMAFYESYVPSIYVPEPVVMEAILKAVDMNGATKYLPKLWSDMILFDHTTRESLVSLFIETLYRNPVKDDEILAKKLADTAESIYTKIEEQNNEAIVRRNPVSWTGSMLGHLMGVFLQADRFEKACMILTKLDREMQRVLGVPEIRPLTAFVDYSIQRKDADNAIWCVQYCFDAGYEETQSLGQNIYSKLKLSDNQLSRLKTIVNLDAAEAENRN